MAAIQWRITPGAAVGLALFYFFDNTGVLAALFPAVLAHELGHCAALRLSGAKLRRISVSVFGIEIDYDGFPDRAGELTAIAAGPAAGFLYAALGLSLGGTFWRYSGGVSLALSLFNLLPMLPLDGGRLTAAIAGEGFARKLSRWGAFFFFVLGLWLLWRYHVPTAALVGLWLVWHNLKGIRIQRVGTVIE